MNFEGFSREGIYEKIEWIKEKGFWMIVAMLVTATVFFLALWFVLLVMFLIKPQPYSAVLTPEFQVKKSSSYRLFSVFENLALKGDLCNEESYVYAGSSMNQE
jgi:hypothetical protein